jgi:hypothetical protein
MIAAAIRPEVTYHLAPLLVAGAPPVAMTLDRAQVPLSRVLVPAAGVGLALATIVAALLTTVGWLNGPAVEPFSNVLAETIAGAGLGAARGMLMAAVRRH